MALTTSACFDFDYDIMPLGIFISIRKNFRPKGNVAAHTAISQELNIFKILRVYLPYFRKKFQIVASSNSCRKFTYIRHFFCGNYLREETMQGRKLFAEIR